MTTSDAVAETIWKNGHGFTLDLPTSKTVGHLVGLCKKCGIRSDSSRTARPCVGHDVWVPSSGNGLKLTVTFRPKGRKAVDEDVWLDIDALGAMLDLVRSVPQEYRGHAFWHWSNPDREYPCETCPGAAGEAVKARRLAQASAIDVEARPADLKLPAGRP